MKEELQKLRAQINLGGITRKEAAGALHLSYSTLNRKLRGEIAFCPGEAARLHALVQQRQGEDR